MARVVLTPALRGEYSQLFDSCRIRPERGDEVESLVKQLLNNQPRYEKVAEALGIPWSFIAVIHNMESSQSFHKHLHNGDPLTARTVQEPPARPKSGSPPFTWEQSAADALQLKRLGADTDWSLAGTLYQLERYNGFGYRLYHPHVLSPYLWGFSNHYSSGKYVADGTWSDSAVSKQCGAAVLLRVAWSNSPISRVLPPAAARWWRVTRCRNLVIPRWSSRSWLCSTGSTVFPASSSRSTASPGSGPPRPTGRSRGTICRAIRVRRNARRPERIRLCPHGAEPSWNASCQYPCKAPVRVKRLNWLGKTSGSGSCSTHR